MRTAFGVLAIMGIIGAGGVGYVLGRASANEDARVELGKVENAVRELTPLMEGAIKTCVAHIDSDNGCKMLHTMKKMAERQRGEAKVAFLKGVNEAIISKCSRR